MKKTPWFPASVQPVHEGLYECDRWIGIHDEPYDYADSRQREVALLHWDLDTGWSYSNGLFAAMYASQGDQWRGLAEEPK